MDEEKILEKKVEKDIEVSFKEMGNRPQVATRIIKNLNFKSKDELIKSGIKYRTNMVMEVEKVFTKRNLIQQAQNKLIHLRRNVKWFNNIYKKNG